MKFFTENWLYLLLVGTAMGIYILIACPYLRDHGHDILCFSGFAFFAILFVYGRALPAPVRKCKRKKPPAVDAGSSTKPGTPEI
jgi:hypothetical protein